MNGGGEGRVDLVGGGPGPLDLMTLRAHRLLWEADVVVADRKCRIADLRSSLGPDVIVVAVEGGATPSRSDIELVIRHARAGRRVVRLTAGDPFVLGGGGEALASWRAAGLETSVTPGISGAVATPQAAGIPVTHRGLATGFRVIDGSRALDPDLFAGVGRGTTVVVLEGTGAKSRIVSAALSAGVHADVPVAIVDGGSGSARRTIRTTLRSAEVATATAVFASGVGFAHEVIVIGDVAGASLDAAMDALSASPA